jgi:predicted porin
MEIYRMKKTLFAIAVATAFTGAAQAQSSVTVYGIIDAGVNTVNSNVSSSSTTESYNTTNSGKGGLSSPRIGFMGREDLGGGMAIRFQLENEFNQGTTFATFAARQTWLGIEQKGTGLVKLGRTTGLIHDAVTSQLATGANNTVGDLVYYAAITGSTGLPATAANRIQAVNGNAGAYANTATNANLSQVFVDRAFTFNSESFAGFKVNAQFAEDSVKDDTSASNTRVSTRGVGVDYTWKNLNVIAARSQVTSKVPATLQARNTTSAIGGNYNFGFLRAYYLFANNESADDYTNAINRKDRVQSFGVRAPIGKVVTGFAQYAVGDTQLYPITSATTSYKRDGYQVGALYSMSKRTDLYAIYGSQKAEDKATGTKVSSTLSGYSLGIRHTF